VDGDSDSDPTLKSVIPAKAGIHAERMAIMAKDWIPAFAGMTINVE